MLVYPCGTPISANSPVIYDNVGVATKIHKKWT